MTKLNIPYCLHMPDVCVCICFIFNNVEKMHFSFRSSKQEKMTHFREKSNYLKSLFIASNPAENFFLWKVTVLNNKKYTSPPLL